MNITNTVVIVWLLATNWLTIAKTTPTDRRLSATNHQQGIEYSNAVASFPYNGKNFVLLVDSVPTGNTNNYRDVVEAGPAQRPQNTNRPPQNTNRPPFRGPGGTNGLRR